VTKQPSVREDGGPRKEEPMTMTRSGFGKEKPAEEKKDEPRKPTFMRSGPKKEESGDIGFMNRSQFGATQSNPISAKKEDDKKPEGGAGGAAWRTSGPAKTDN
jgi:hypothetical protein